MARNFLVGLVWLALALGGCAHRTSHATVPVAKAALPMDIRRGTGEPISFELMVRELRGVQAVCVGEEHTNPHHHWVQLEIINALRTQPEWQAGALGLEMIQFPFQAPLSQYARGEIDEAGLQASVEWRKRWAYEFGLYREQLLAARASWQLLALNAPKELTKKIVRQGVEGLTPEERATLPAIDVTNQAHRTWFEQVMMQMGGAEHAQTRPSAAAGKPPVAKAATGMPSMERIYAVQVAWDITMAAKAAEYIQAAADRRVVVLAGNGHCHELGIEARLKTFGVAQTASVRPIVVGSEDDVASQAQLYDYVIRLRPR